jgi:steroid 5-alpha reductase family enzyme
MRNDDDGTSTVASPTQFWTGVALGLVGFVIGCASDRTLVRLTTQGRTTDGGTGRYRIPRGGLFEYVSSPHYLGEILEWTGYALACDLSLSSVSFLVWTMANLIPRAVLTHRWYHETFREDYPSSRKAIVPFLL